MRVPIDPRVVLLQFVKLGMRGLKSPTTLWQVPDMQPTLLSVGKSASGVLLRPRTGNNPPRLLLVTVVVGAIILLVAVP
jgi:hypothetical protein